MRRRDFIAGLGGAVAWPLAAFAQRGQRQRRLGMLLDLRQNDPPLINGLSIVEEWDRGTADYIDGNGPVTVQYTVYVMENGDRFFTRLAEVVEATAAGDVTVTYVGHITGGTGRLVGIQGIVRGASHINFKTGFNENQTEIEYSIDNIKK